MKQLGIFLWVIILLFSFQVSGQVNNYKQVEVSVSVNDNMEIFCTNSICFYLSRDSSFINLNLNFFEKTKGTDTSELLDQTDDTPYGSKLHFFQSKREKDYILLWETEYEFSPTLIGYYINDNVVMKIGIFNIYSACEDCDELTYPIERMEISKVNSKQLEFLFLDKVVFISETGLIETFNSNQFKYIFNIEKKELNNIITF